MAERWESDQLENGQRQPVGLFDTLKGAESALGALQEAGFSTDQLSLVSQQLNPLPRLEETEASESAKKGAIAGAVLGGLVGFLLGYVSLTAVSAFTVDPTSRLLGMTLAGSGIGAVGSSLMGGLSGATVFKPQIEPDYIDLEQGYLIVVEGTTEELQQAEKIIQPLGNKI